MKALSPVFLSHVQRLTEDGSPYLLQRRRESGFGALATIACIHLVAPLYICPSSST